MQLRQKLFIVLSLMAMVPLLFLLFGVVGHMEADLEQRTSSELHKTLRKMAQELKTLMNNQKAIVQGLAKVPVIREFAEAQDSRDSQHYENKANQLAAFFLNYQATVPSIQAVRFTDINGKTLVKVKEGRLVASKKRSKSGKAFIENISNKPFFRRALITDLPVSVSDFERGKVEGEVDYCPAMVRYSVPIKDELDTMIGMLVVNMWGRRVDHTVEAALGGYPGNVYVVEVNDSRDRDGIYLYHKNPDYRFGNQLKTDHRFYTVVSKTAWDRIRNGKDQTGLYEQEDGKMYFWFRHAPYKDLSRQWLLVIEVDRAVVYAPVEQLRSWIGLLIAAMLALSILIARWSASRLSRPVHELARIITRFADGDKKVRYEKNREDEIGLAGKAFNYLSENLEKAEAGRDKAEMAVRQSERLAAIGEMAAGIGHEINNPLMNIMSLTSLVEQSLPEGNEQLHSDIKAIKNEGNRCAQIVRGILNFARETPPEFRQFDICRMLHETADLMRHRIEVSGISLDTECEAELLIEGDSSQLQQVIVNVLLNAMQVSPAKSSIRISAALVKGQAEVVIRDQGPGVKEEDLGKVFNPFFSTKGEGEGTGLGLSVSYGIVRKHDGSITMENHPDGGAIVRITLPLTQKQGSVAGAGE